MGTLLTVESDAPGVAAELPTLRTLRDSIAKSGGAWEVSRAPHGASWIVEVVMPVQLLEATAEAV